ncbi:response regulator transcription factor [Glycomyces sp. L485]|uniref:response regulator transcription factor n=1 Tax=Glycomyces sp. L485 TaxID=2909235 RepID=UPI001F4B44D8|nr:response regulator transcription factor [Glycomyces sp. L485]MCH7229447.1 response regulator transcription factor [Glycomyces sp. L485]
MIDASSDKPRILVVDDEGNNGVLLSAALRLTGFEAVFARDGAEALRYAEDFAPDLVVLDVALPDIDGPELVERLRAGGRDLPALYLASPGAARDRFAGHECVAKPFDLEAVVLRIQAVLRRAGADMPTEEQLLRYADLELDEARYEVRRAGRAIELSPVEFRLLRYLMINAGKVVSRDQILDRVWQYDFGGNNRVVEACVHYLRRKIDVMDPPLIQTVRGFGYALRRPGPAR